jgi:hypothetical protein
MDMKIVSHTRDGLKIVSEAPFMDMKIGTMKGANLFK